MNIRSLLFEVVVVFLVTFIVAVLVTFLWNTIRHGVNTVDWDTAFVLAITFGIVLPLAGQVQKRKE